MLPFTSCPVANQKRWARVRIAVCLPISSTCKSVNGAPDIEDEALDGPGLPRLGRPEDAWRRRVRNSVSQIRLLQELRLCAPHRPVLQLVPVHRRRPLRPRSCSHLPTLVPPSWPTRCRRQNETLFPAASLQARAGASQSPHVRLRSVVSRPIP